MYVGAFQKSHVHLNYISFILYSSARTYDVLLLEMGPINFVQMTGIETWTQSLWLIRTSGVPLDRLMITNANFGTDSAKDRWYRCELIHCCR